MRWLIGAVITAVALWSGYWAIASGAKSRIVASWIEDRRADGWVAEYATLETRGYPNRIDTVITDLELADPTTGVAVILPRFDIFTLSYKPNHMIAQWPETFVLASPLERLDIASSAMRASLIVAPDTRLALRRSTITIEEAHISSSEGWNIALDRGVFATREAVGIEHAHDVGLRIEGYTPAAATRTLLDPANLLPEKMERVEIDTTLGFDAPWDLDAIERGRPALTSVNIKLARAVWGGMDFHATGRLQVDTAGLPEGEIAIRAANWRAMLRLARAAGWVTADMEDVLARGLEVLARASGDPETLDAPLRFQRGRMSFGPIPLGPAPQLLLR